ncbi:MAG: dTMP kinase [Bacteroidota bacterium]|nr:dTMP kinase [Bacteroidota bacterium]
MFISFEGIDFSGKSTQITLLLRRLENASVESLLVREPGGTEISERIRTLLLDPSHGNMDPVSEFLLFSASRSQLVQDVIAPALRRRVLVIADRFFDSSTAYQGYGRGLDLEALQRVHQLATHGISPDMTFFMDIPVAESFARRPQRAGDTDRMENAGEDFYRRVRDGYLRLAAKFPARILVIDGVRPAEEIAEQIWERISAKLVSPTHDTEGEQA